jgi:predicted nuclease of predicted toxin-antitoxin system
MKLLADEGVDGPVVAWLRNDGHDVAWIAEDSPGVGDDAILARAYAEGVVLITSGKDFGELV